MYEAESWKNPDSQDKKEGVKNFQTAFTGYRYILTDGYAVLFQCRTTRQKT